VGWEDGLGGRLVRVRIEKLTVCVVVEVGEAERWLGWVGAVAPQARREVEAVVGEQSLAVIGDERDRLDDVTEDVLGEEVLKLTRTQPGLIPSQPRAISRS
jgi:hypothetical protein